MPIVPFTNAPRTAPVRKLPSDAEPFALMAAALMDAEGRLVEKEAAEETVPNE